MVHICVNKNIHIMYVICHLQTRCRLLAPSPLGGPADGHACTCNFTSIHTIHVRVPTQRCQADDEHLSHTLVHTHHFMCQPESLVMATLRASRGTHSPAENSGCVCVGGPPSIEAEGKVKLAPASAAPRTRPAPCRAGGPACRRSASGAAAPALPASAPHTSPTPAWSMSVLQRPRLPYSLEDYPNPIGV